jgi:hypothetical protein
MYAAGFAISAAFRATKADNVAHAGIWTANSYEPYVSATTATTATTANKQRETKWV